MDTTSFRPRYGSLRDYLRVLRRYWLMIAILCVVGAAAGYATAGTATTSYQATAQVAFLDPTQQLSIVGLGSGFVQSPAQLAQVNAPAATSNHVIESVRRRLRTKIPAAELAGAVTTTVAASAGLLDVTAVTRNPVLSQRLANADANALVDANDAATRAEFRRLAATVRSRIAGLPKRLAPGSRTATQLSFYEDELARLNTASALTNSARVANPAESALASTPGRSRGTLIGLALGLLLGVLVAFVRDSTDPRLRTLHDMRTSFDLPLLGRVRDHSFGGAVSPARVIRGRRDPGVELDEFRILRRNLEFIDRDRPPRSILVTSAVAEEGKTTVARSLAFATALAGKRTLLVDCDLRRPAVFDRLGVNPTPGLVDYLEGRADPGEIVRIVKVDPHGQRPSSNGSKPTGERADLAVIPAGSPTTRSTELLGSSRFADFLGEVSAVYDFVVIDSSPLLPVADTLEILPRVDAVLLCARGARTTRDQAMAAVAALGRFPQRPTGLVITGINSRDAAEFYGYSDGDR